MISLSKVAKVYTSSGGTVRIGPVDLGIPAGGITTFIGLSGAGKPTLLTMTRRLLGLDEGVITVAGWTCPRPVARTWPRCCPSCARRTTSSPG